MSTEVTQKDVENLILKEIDSIINDKKLKWTYESVSSKFPNIEAINVLSQAYQRIKCTPSN